MAAHSPFDHTLSGLLDALVILIEHRPPLIVRVVLRWWKSRLERRVPAWKGGAQ